MKFGYHHLLSHHFKFIICYHSDNQYSAVWVEILLNKLQLTSVDKGPIQCKFLAFSCGLFGNINIRRWQRRQLPDWNLILFILYFSCTSIYSQGGSTSWLPWLYLSHHVLLFFLVLLEPFENHFSLSNSLLSICLIISLKAEALLVVCLLMW